MNYYVAFLDDEGGGDYGVVFPDFPGCASQGSTFEDALRMGAEALALHVAAMQEDRVTIPQPRTLEEIRAAGEDWYDAEEKIRGVAAVIPLLPEPEEKPRPTNLSLEPSLVKAVDRYAAKRKLTRSDIFAEGVRMVMTLRPVGSDRSNHRKRASHR
jgi:predicted RNase H-like HicB family nuclease